jgi:hypothetical protein
MIKNKKLENRIDTLISKLQAYGYRIIINKHNLGSLRNVGIYRYNRISNPGLFNKDVYKLDSIDKIVLDFPKEYDILIEKLSKILMEEK